MKNILSIWLCQTLSILVLEYISICHAYDPRELYDLVGSNHQLRSNRLREPYNLKRANEIYEAVRAGSARRLKQHDHIGRAPVETKFTRPRKLRKPLQPDEEHHFRSAYGSAHGFSNVRIGDSSETEANNNIIEGDASNGSVTNEDSNADNTGISTPNRILANSNFDQSSATSCTCSGPEHSDVVNSLCFTSTNGGDNFSMKYKGTTKFKLEDIIKAYRVYFDNVQFDNNYSENVLNANDIVHHQFNGDNKFHFNHEVNFNTGADSKLNTNEIQKDANKLNVFDKFDINAFKKNFNKFDLTLFNNIMKNNGKFNAETLKALKKIQASSNFFKNNKFQINTDLQGNGQADIEAYVKALSQAKAFAKLQAIAQAQSQYKGGGQPDAHFQAMTQNQIFSQSQAEAQAQAMAQAQAQVQAQAQEHAQAQAEAQAQAQAQAQAEAQQAQAMAQAQAQADSQMNAQGQTQSPGQGQTYAQFQAHKQVNENVQGHGQGQINSQSQSFSFSNGNNNAFGFGGGGTKTINGNGGFKVAGYKAFSGTIGGNYGKQTSGSFSMGGGGGEALSFGGGGGGAFGLNGGGGGGFSMGGGASGGIIGGALGTMGGGSGGAGFAGAAVGGMSISGAAGGGGGGGASGGMDAGGASGGGMAIGGAAAGGIAIGGAAAGGIAGGAVGGMSIAKAASGGFAIGGGSSRGYGVSGGTGGGFSFGGGLGGMIGRGARTRDELNFEDRYEDANSDGANPSASYAGVLAIPASNPVPYSRFSSDDPSNIEPGFAAYGSYHRIPYQL